MCLQSRLSSGTYMCKAGGTTSSSNRLQNRAAISANRCDSDHFFITEQLMWAGTQICWDCSCFNFMGCLIRQTTGYKRKWNKANLWLYYDNKMVTFVSAGTLCAVAWNPAQTRSENTCSEWTWSWTSWGTRTETLQMWCRWASSRKTPTSTSLWSTPMRGRNTQYSQRL